MRTWFVLFLLSLFGVNIAAQSDLQQIFETEKAFQNAIAQKGVKPAFLEFFSDDAIIFSPDAVNAKEYWKAQPDSSAAILIRNNTYTDVSSNGQLGYTTGNWEFYPQGKSGSLIEYGQFTTVWEKRMDGKFRASFEIRINHDKPLTNEVTQTIPTEQPRDTNLRGWSAADPSMQFFKMSMEKKSLGSAYNKFAADEIRLLRDREVPILGRKSVVKETKEYNSLEFPTKVALFQAADMAYVWNPCEYANSKEGVEKGNCLHIWKLRNEKWWIVLGVFARIQNETPPQLTVKRKPRVNPNIKKKKN